MGYGGPCFLMKINVIKIKPGIKTEIFFEKIVQSGRNASSDFIGVNSRIIFFSNHLVSRTIGSNFVGSSSLRIGNQRDISRWFYVKLHLGFRRNTDY